MQQLISTTTNNETNNNNNKHTLDPILTLTVPHDITLQSNIINNDNNNNNNNNNEESSSLSGSSGLITSVTGVAFLGGTNNIINNPNISSTHHKQQQNQQHHQHNNNNIINSSRNDNDHSSSSSSSDDDDDDDDDEEVLQFRCQQLLHNEKRNDNDIKADAINTASTINLANRNQLLASCHGSGDTLLWDLNKRKIINNQLITPNRGPGLTIRRINNNENNFLYQTRDMNGTVTVHDLEYNDDMTTSLTKIIQTYETKSRTFCQAVPCNNLIIMPTFEHSFATIRDLRVSNHGQPIAFFHAVHGGLHHRFNQNMVSEGHRNNDNNKQNHGMLTSLGMSTDNNGGKTIIACGMESGTVFFHDLAMLRYPIDSNTRNNNNNDVNNTTTSSIKLSNEPILSIDMFPSTLQHNSKNLNIQSSMVTIAGMAGNVNDLQDRPESERGRVAVIKTSIRQDDGTIQTRLRTRINTFASYNNNNNKEFDKIGSVGAAICRFRNDGRYFAIGGWDRRLRIYDRRYKQNVNPVVAILRGHTSSVNVMDWAPDSYQSGLLATGSNDGRIFIWRCLSSTS